MAVRPQMATPMCVGAQAATYEEDSHEVNDVLADYDLVALCVDDMVPIYERNRPCGAATSWG